uniref:Beta-galactosidase n=1 Tax=Timema douglasi TaxID=61478 RepID=A0A7R8VKC7_TIMDO|nr:unnamed protein product [Timema douglasi]
MMNQTHSDKLDHLVHISMTVSSCIVILLSAFLGLLQWADQVHAQDELPTVYGYYTEGGITSGLEATPDAFLLNGKNITLISGTIHYFRVHPDYWRDRLRKLRAGGFVGVETYIPWNLHEPRRNVYDFGNGGNDLSPFADVVSFLKIAQEEDLLVILRPGPFINAEWENGGLPSWLYRDAMVVTRSSNAHYITYMTEYFNQLFPLIKDLQFTSGGPIIAFQVENEFGNKARGQSKPDTAYLETIIKVMEDNGLTALKFTADSVISSGTAGSVAGAMMTANLGSGASQALTKLKQLQPDKPLWVMEFWTGSWDHWFEEHSTKTAASCANTMNAILSFPANINLYVFHGGSDFCFMNSATYQSSFPTYRSDVSSYDYDAPLTEAGDYTDKYTALVALVTQYSPVKFLTPQLPEESVKEAYPSAEIVGHITLDKLLNTLGSESSTNVKAMEFLDINDNSGQSFGFIVYRKTGLAVSSGSVLKIDGQVRDLAIVLVDGVRKTDVFTSMDQQKGFGYFDAESDAQLTLDDDSVGESRTLDILVENWGHRDDTKGIISGSVLLNSVSIQDWELFPLELKGDWVRSLDGWITPSEAQSPAMYRATVDVSSPHDTFLDMSSWGKGNVFVNGFNVGRYFPAAGPAKTLYIPAPLLNAGTNEILVFELFTPASQLVFRETPILG